MRVTSTTLQQVRTRGTAAAVSARTLHRMLAPSSGHSGHEGHAALDGILTEILRSETCATHTHCVINERLSVCVCACVRVFVCVHPILCDLQYLMLYLCTLRARAHFDAPWHPQLCRKSYLSLACPATPFLIWLLFPLAFFLLAALAQAGAARPCALVLSGLH